MEKTLGIEVETVSLPQTLWEHHSPWKVFTDGSIRNYRTTDLVLLEDPFHAGGKRNNQVKFGAELVSPIISVNPFMWNEISKVFHKVYESGETSHANMSIHIHVGFTFRFKKLARAIPFLKEVDKLLFDVSTAGQEPRGSYNNFLYYRPLESPPWATDGNDEYRPSIGNLDVCSSRYDFQFCLGRKELATTKWYPARYCGLNLASLFEHGTLEFRHFNFTNDLLIIRAWVYLCLGIHECINTGKFRLDLSDLIYLGGKNLESQKSLSYIIRHLPVKNVYDGINKSPMATHTGKYIKWFKGILETLTVPASEIIPQQHLEYVEGVCNQHPTDNLEKPNLVTFLF